MLHVQGNVAPAGIRCLQWLLRDQVLQSSVYVDSTHSTNTLALQELVQQSDISSKLPRLYLTDSQTAGRGRMGRSWSSDDDSLTFSILLENDGRSSKDSLPLSLRAGVATAEAIDALLTPITSHIKWPNDIYIEGQKVGGILVEANQKYPSVAVVGIGVNIQSAPSLESRDTATKAVSLATFASREVDRIDVLDEIIRRFLQPVLQQPMAANDPSQTLANRFRQKCYLTGQRISLRQSGQPLEGICRGIDDQGRLLVDTGEQLTTIQSGEATVVRRSQ